MNAKAGIAVVLVGPVVAAAALIFLRKSGYGRSKYPKPLAIAAGVVAITAAVSVGFFADGSDKIIAAADAPNELAKAVRDLATTCGVDPDDVQREIDEFDGLNTKDVEEMVHGLIAAFAVLVLLPPLVYAASQRESAWKSTRCVAIVTMGIAITFLGAAAFYGGYMCTNVLDDLSEPLSYLFEKSATDTVPPYLDTGLWNDLRNNCGTNPTIDRWTKPGPLSDEYDGLKNSICKGLVPSASVATFFATALVVAAVATVERAGGGSLAGSLL